MHWDDPEGWDGEGGGMGFRMGPMDCSPPGFSVYGISQARILGWVLPFPSLGDLPNPGIKPVSPRGQVDSLLMSQSLPHQGSPGALVNHKQMAQVFRPSSDRVCRADTQVLHTET